MEKNLKKGHLNDFSQLFNLIFASSNIVVRYIRLFFDLHHGNRRIDLRGERNLDVIFRPVNPLEKQKERKLQEQGRCFLYLKKKKKMEN